MVIPLSRGDAEAGLLDYTAPESITFESGDTEKTFTFSATDDEADDDGETAILRLVDARLLEDVTAGSTDETTITIVDNDNPEIFVSFENSYYGATGGGRVTMKTLMSAEPERTVTVLLSTRNRARATGDDYSGIPASVRFDAPETEKTFTVTAAQNDDDETDAVEISLVIHGTYRVGYGLKDVAVLFINESSAQATPSPGAHSSQGLNAQPDPDQPVVARAGIRRRQPHHGIQDSCLHRPRRNLEHPG